MNRSGTLAAAALAALAGIAPGALHAAPPTQVGTVPSGAQKVMDEAAITNAIYESQ